MGPRSIVVGQSECPGLVHVPLHDCLRYGMRCCCCCCCCWTPKCTPSLSPSSPLFFPFLPNLLPGVGGRSASLILHPFVDLAHLSFSLVPLSLPSRLHLSSSLPFTLQCKHLLACRLAFELNQCGSRAVSEEEFTLLLAEL